MSEYIRIGTFFILFFSIWRGVTYVIQRRIAAAQGEPIEFFIGKRPIKSSKDWRHLFFSAVVATVSFLLAGLILIALMEIGWMP